jgi:hypothetical protein
MKSLINVKQWMRNLSKSGTNSTFFLTKFSKFAWQIGNYIAYFSKPRSLDFESTQA